MPGINQTNRDENLTYVLTYAIHQAALQAAKQKLFCRN